MENSMMTFERLPDGTIKFYCPMTMRAYIATAALQGLLAGRHTSDVHGIRHDAYSADAPEWAKQSVVYADALLAELAKS